MFDLNEARGLLQGEDRQKLDAALKSVSTLKGKISHLAEPEAQFSSVERKVERLQGEVNELRKALDEKKRILGEEELKLGELRQPFRESVAQIGTALTDIKDLFVFLLSRYDHHPKRAIIIAALSTWKRDFDRVQNDFKNTYGRYL